jgi:hypothetical protein
MTAPSPVFGGTVAELDRLRSRADDVGEEDCAEDAVRLSLLPAARLVLAEARYALMALRPGLAGAARGVPSRARRSAGVSRPWITSW